MLSLMRRQSQVRVESKVGFLQANVKTAEGPILRAKRCCELGRELSEDLGRSRAGDLGK